MPLFTSSDEWQRQSALLLQARPTTTRITTKYTLPSASLISKKRKRAAPTTSTSTEADTTWTPKAQLILKTYDPESGVTLKYKTDKAAEVGRLIGGLGRLGRYMAALPEAAEDVAMADAGAGAEQGTGTSTPLAEAPAPAAAVEKSQGGGGKGGKKKKGKR